MGEERNGGFWQRVQEKLFRPRVDDKALNDAMEAARQQQPPPVLWLLGKTQSGKTSIIRNLTGSPDAEIGNGFKPCTRTARFYEFPEEAPLVRFLDTRGLGEVDYDPAEDIRYCQDQAHLVIAVLKVTDQRQEAILRVLKAVRKRHPDWPLVIVQTCLHEAYGADDEHPAPYPFDQPSWTDQVSDDLRRTLLSQRDAFAHIPGTGPVQWVAVDLTLPEDDFEPADYGIEALWAAIEQATSLGLEARLRADTNVRDTFSRAAHPHIVGYSLAAAGVGALPLVDLALVPGTQLKMFHTLASLYQMPWNPRTSSEFFGLLGAGFLAGYGLQLAGRSLIKLIPAGGQTLGAVWGATSSAAVTFALGKAACFYLHRTGKGLQVDADALREVYRDAFLKGRRLLSDESSSSGDAP